MLLNELFDSEKSDLKWTEAVQNLIDKHGLQKFQGLQATVISTPDRAHVYRIWVKDRGYEKWLDIALKHQDNPHVMKVLGKPRELKTRFKRLPSDLKVKFIKLEKLRPLTGELQMFVGDACDVITDMPVAQRKRYTVDEFIEHLDASSLDLAKKHRSFLETMLEISREGFNDWNTDNVMKRGNVLVITDPASEFY